MKYTVSDNYAWQTMFILLSTDAAKVPVVCVTVGGGPNTLKRVRNAITYRTPAVIVKVSHVVFLSPRDACSTKRSIAVRASVCLSVCM